MPGHLAVGYVTLNHVTLVRIQARQLIRNSFRAQRGIEFQSSRASPDEGHSTLRVSDSKRRTTRGSTNRMSYFVYILECADKSLYVGCANNLEKRIKEHNESKWGAHYTKIRRPVKLVYSETFKTLIEARRREKENISALDESIIEEPKAKYIAYKLTTNFCDIVVLKDSLKIFLNVPSGKLDDPAGLARDLTKPKPIGHWGNGDYEVKLERKEEVEKVAALIKQSYNYNK